MGKIAIVGQGYMGRTHAQAWTDLGRQDDIAYICTPRPAASFDSAPAAVFVTDLAEVLKDSQVEIVSICSPTSTHRELTVAALAAGKHVLLEKPIALTEADAVAIEEAGAQASGTLMIAQVLRFFAGYRALRADLDEGNIGEVYSARARRLASASKFSPWLADESQSGGILIDVCIHDFDYLNMLMGTPRSVRTTRPIATGPAEVTIRYENGGVGQVLSTYGLPAGAPFTASLEVIGSRGLAETRFTAGAPTGDVNGSNSALSLDEYRIAGVNGARIQRFRDDKPYTAQARYFLECIENGVKPDLVPTAAAVLALRVGQAARRSLEEGRDIDI
jgi:predicted dehydrogenase